MSNDSAASPKRRRLLPSNKTVRYWRDRALWNMRLARTYVPEWFIRNPEAELRNFLPMLVAARSWNRSEFTFVQIGAFDGKQNDELFSILQSRPARGVLVEPQPAAFAHLKKLHGSNPQIKLINGAVDRVAGQRAFFSLKSGPTEVASFSRRHLIKHGFSDDQIIESRVECVTIDDIVRTANFDRLDLLQIDTEGHDFQILQTIDFSKLKPGIVRFEHAHMQPHELQQCVEKLAAAGYQFLVERLNAVAVLTDASVRSQAA